MCHFLGHLHAKLGWRNKFPAKLRNVRKAFLNTIQTEVSWWGQWEGKRKMLGVPCADVGIWIRHWKPLCPTVSLWDCLQQTEGQLQAQVFLSCGRDLDPEMNSVAAAHLWPAACQPQPMCSVCSVCKLCLLGDGGVRHLPYTYTFHTMCAALCGGIWGFTQAFSLPAHSSDGMNCCKSGACMWLTAEVAVRGKGLGSALSTLCAAAWVYPGWQTLLQWKPVCPAYPSTWFTVLMPRTQLINGKRISRPVDNHSTKVHHYNQLPLKGLVRNGTGITLLSFVSLLSGSQSFI